MWRMKWGRKKTGVSDLLTDEQLAFLECYPPPPQLFAVVTWGCAATSWLAHVLNSHPDIYCAHAANVFWSKLGNIPQLDGLKYLRIIGSQGYCYKAAGDVHGVSREAVKEVRAVLGDDFSCAVVIREPIARLHSQVALFARFKGLPLWNVDYLNHVIGRLSLPDPSYETRLFVHGVNMLNSVVQERHVAPIYRSEDLTANPAILREFAELVTGGKVKFTDNWAEEMISRPSLNPHRTPEQKVKDFADWQIDVIRSVVDPEAWRIYSEFGYEVPGFVNVVAKT